MPGQPPPPDEDPRPHDGPARRQDTTGAGPTAEDRRRIMVIALFIGVSLVIAIVLAYFYAMPSAE